MDLVANRLGHDPADGKRRSFIQPQQMPCQICIMFRDGRLVTCDGGDYLQCRRAALQAVDWDDATLSPAFPHWCRPRLLAKPDRT